ncbi:TonB family protein [Marinospirillum alkaliphilum]|uniref:Protein TonB n=1 Tax=Marinospirillum alkaliphilum DSM 21637 TaxID=1122209 RepID=A0A1K1V013_9GAMM|nr:TonB family protein [Marinospirillum alkaliphilum]SFX17901.1 outer membrane transport energization protein TonB [Marinospirillum alkaliphilum DSM 21637]
MMLERARNLMLMPLAAGLSISLFAGLGWIIQSPVGGSAEAPQRFAMNWVQLTPEPDLEVLRPPPPPPPPEAPSVMPEMASTSSAAATSAAIPSRLDMNLPALDMGMADPGLPSLQGLGGMGQSEMPVYRENPQYPRQALVHRLEGWVELSFEVDARGQVIPDSIEVIAAEPEQVFDRAARRALARWRFAAHEMNAGGSRRLQQRLEFRLEGEG